MKDANLSETRYSIRWALSRAERDGFTRSGKSVEKIVPMIMPPSAKSVEYWNRLRCRQRPTKPGRVPCAGYACTVKQAETYAVPGNGPRRAWRL